MNENTNMINVFEDFGNELREVLDQIKAENEARTKLLGMLYEKMKKFSDSLEGQNR